MIIDYHSHFVQPEYFGEKLREEWKAVGYQPFLPMTFEQYDEAMKPVDRAIVFGLTASAMGVRTPHEDIAAIVKRNPSKYIGFMALDPCDRDALQQMDVCVHDLGLKGIKLYPTMQHFDIREERFGAFFERAQKHRLPILIHFGASPFPQSRLCFSQPLLLDDVAITFPEIRFIIAHLGHPWQRDTVVLLRKHKNIFADISGLWHRPWEGYNALVSCIEWSVTNKLLLGSDFPIWTPADAMSELRAVRKQFQNSGLPQIPEEVIEGIIHRNALALLGLDAT